MLRSSITTHFLKIRTSTPSRTNTNNQTAPPNDDILHYIGCPISKTPLTKVSDTELKSESAKIMFTIRDGIPILNPVKGRLIKGDKE